MAVKNYGIHDQWANLDTLNNVDIKSVNGVIESVKINGEEAGGGSSDFSTAEVTIINEKITPCEGIGCFAMVENITPAPDPSLPPLVEPAESIGGVIIPSQETTILNVVLYKGRALLYIYDDSHNQILPTATTGEIEVDAPKIIITGDCTLTIS